MDRTELYLSLILSLSKDINNKYAGGDVNYKYKLMRLDSLIRVIEDAIRLDRAVSTECWKQLHTKCAELYDNIDKILFEINSQY